MAFCVTTQPIFPSSSLLSSCAYLMFVYRRTLIHKSSECLSLWDISVSVAIGWGSSKRDTYLSSVRYGRGTRPCWLDACWLIVSFMLVWYVPKHTTLMLKVRGKSEWKARSEESIETAEQQETCVSLLNRVKWWANENRWAAYSMPDVKGNLSSKVREVNRDHWAH